jgi:uroporphyrinogen decarboxylase
MNARERVRRALRRDGLPDRVPIQFDLSRPLLEAFSQKLDIPIGWQPNYYEDLKYRTSGNEIRVAMGSDCVLVGGGVPHGYQPEQTDDGCIVNEFGMKMKMGLAWYDVVEGPLESCTSVLGAQAARASRHFMPGGPRVTIGPADPVVGGIDDQALRRLRHRGHRRLGS